jgi:hypothetical protein
MEKQASNTFVGGMNTDRHPLTSQNTELIDAQNIDLIQVGEGYQLILQKREGNTEVLLDSNGDGAPDVPNVSAGLPDGFIPLAVKEFNNIAYIVSVNPITQEGELGTFPSPNYDSFEFVHGSPIGGGATVDGGSYNSTADTAEYSYSFTEVVNAGNDEEVDGNEDVNFPLTQAGFTIVNTGLNLESYDFELDSTTGIKMYTNGIEFIHGTTSPYTLAPGASMTMVIKVNTPFALTPTAVNTRVITITPQDDPTPVIETHTFLFHTTIVMQIKNLAGTWVHTFPITENTDATGHLVTYDARSNDGAMTFGIAITSQDPNTAWATVSSTLQLSLSANGSGSIRTVNTTITGTYSGGTKTADTHVLQQTS